MTKILFLIPSLGGGGAEVQAIRLANFLDRRRFEVSVATVRSGGEFESALDTNISLHVLPQTTSTNVAKRLVSNANSLRKIIQKHKPDVVYSTLSAPNLIAALSHISLLKRPRLIMSLQNVPSMLYRKSPKLRWADRLSLLRAHRVIVPSEGIATELKNQIPLIAKRIIVVPNVGMQENQVSERENELDEFKIVSVGRFVAQKNFGLLLDAFALAAKKISATLTMYGEGEQRLALTKRIVELDISDKVSLPGIHNNLSAALVEADLFVLTSHYEGFGNVLIEAMACGVPVIAVDCPYGPAEIITHGVNGILVKPHAETIAAEIVALARSPERLTTLGAAAQERATAFAPNKIMPIFEELFDRINH